MSDDSSKAVAKQSPKWSVGAAIAVTLLATVVTQYIAAVIVAMYPALAGWSAEKSDTWLFHSPVANFITILVFDVLALLVVWAFVAGRKVSFWGAVALRRMHWRHAGMATLGFLSYMGMATVALTVLPLIFPIDTTQEQATGFEPGGGNTAVALAFMGLVVLAPLVEEIVFRGFLYGTLRTHAMSAGLAAVIISVLFGALHLFGSADGGLLWLGFADTFVLSLVLCYVREQTGSLWPAVGIHFLKNAFVFLNIFILAV